MEANSMLKSRKGQYELIEQIGMGAYGQVYLATDMQSGEEVAIKEIDVLQSDRVIHKHLIMISRELQILHKMSKLKNNNFIVQLLDVFVNPEASSDFNKLTKLYLVMEYMANDMKNLLDSQTPIDGNQVKCLVFNLLLAVKFLHS